MTTSQNEPWSPPTAPRQRGLLTRIAAPFQPKSRSIVDLRIEMDDPHREYAPGDVVSGSVKFKALKPFRVTHVVVQIRGFVKVYKNPTPPGEGVSSEVAAYSSLSARKGSRNAPGFASIHEDEKVICGSGNLGTAGYEIPFSLTLPNESLPSSLDFERGTISYFLNAVVTRPTTVAPTISAQHKLQLREKIDVGTMASSKRLVISMKPVSRRTRSRATPKDERDRASTLASRSTTMSISEMESSRDQRSISEHSAISGGSSSNSTGARANGAIFEASETEVGSVTQGKRTVSAAVELLREGYLAGDVIPVRVTVKHHKPLKAMRGVIVTLYRRAKIDLLADTDFSKDDSKDDPTKLRGLSGFFTGTSVLSRNFRYDLDQSLADLIINPNTMQAEVKTAIRIPEDAFPTITCVPLGLMTFTYHVEVIMDLMGKLSGLDRLLPRLGMTHTHTGYGFDLAARGSAAHGTASADGRMLDTTSIRRVESIAHCTFNIVVGTKDSARRTLKRSTDLWAEAQRVYGNQERHSTPNAEHEAEEPSRGAVTGATIENGEQAPMWQHAENAPMMIPYPEAEVTPTDEKTRLRRAEEQLLPSQPPEDGPSGSGSASVPMPSAPSLSTIAEQSPAYQLPAVPLPVQNDQDVSEKERMRRHEAALLPGAPDEDENGGPSASGPYQDTVEDARYARYSDATIIASAPAFSNGIGEVRLPTAAPPYAAGSSSAAGSSEASRAGPSATEDKQELERRRLLAEASAPDMGDDDGDVDENEDAPPTAPVFNEADPGEERQWERIEGSTDLPQYQR